MAFLVSAGLVAVATLIGNLVLENTPMPSGPPAPPPGAEEGVQHEAQHGTQDDASESEGKPSTTEGLRS
ncbi:hypothetical protein [Streptomyces sp. NPDC058424]|uniref:hypothetical protein n=1 Tax=Streptomyces sp. NPDC058424 TaxID=3346491 RepID=UPI0036540243